MKFLRVTMPDGSRWDVPVEVIARSRAENYKDEYGDDVARSLAEDTLPLFASTPWQIMDWAANNMNWCDVEKYASRAPDSAPTPVDYEEGWRNGDKEIVEKEPS